MTDFMENILTSMSSAFNKASPPSDGLGADVTTNVAENSSVSSGTDINLIEDKTLKWRSLQKNQFARKYPKKNNSGITTNGTTIINNGEELVSSKTKENDWQSCSGNSNDNHLKEIHNDLEVKDFDGAVNPGLTKSNNNLAIEKHIESSIETINENITKSNKSNGHIKDEPTEANIPIITTSFRRATRGREGGKQLMEKKSNSQVEPTKKRGRGVRKIGDVLSGDGDVHDHDSFEKKLRRSERNSLPDIKPEDSSEFLQEMGKIILDNDVSTLVHNATDVEKTTKTKTARRSGRLKKVESDIGIKDPQPSSKFTEICQYENDKPTINTIEECNDSNNILQLKIEEEKTPKKRGRRSKTRTSSSAQAKLTIITHSPAESIVDENIKKSGPKVSISSDIIPKRSQRRIKPTPKILENDELRYEYETKNIVRITSFGEPSNHELEIEHQKTSEDKEQESNKMEQSNGSSIVPLVIRPTGSSQIKKKLFQSKSNSDSDRSLFQKRQCHTTDVSLNEIKSIGLNRLSIEKKLSKKQQKKLTKQKDKYFERLGLKRNMNNDPSDSINSNTDNEEFVPSKRVQVIGKPSVTLRARTTKDLTSSPLNNSATVILTQKHHKSRSQQISRSQSVAKSQIQEKPLQQSKSTDVVDNLICLCHKPSHYYARNTPETSYCCAIDTIEEQKVGCCNQLSDELLNLLRPSQRVGYMILCKDHNKRLKAHNCCAGCGMFCTQGKFVLCSQQHFFHANCAQKFILNSPYDEANPTNYTSPTLVLKCPHCGQDTPEKTSMVTMKCQTLPVFLPHQKGKIIPAKMSVPDGNTSNVVKNKIPITVSLENLIPESVMNVVIRDNNLRNSIEFSSNDMYYAINNDDLERVAEIIASGYDVTSEMSEMQNGTCLHLVAHFGSLQMAYLLLCKEFSQEFLNMIDKEMKTASMCAIMSDKCDILNLFIQCGADMAIKGTDGMTCLHITAKKGNLDASRMIVESYKNSKNIGMFYSFINAQDDGGWTALVWAAEMGYTEVVSLLLNNGADPNICDDENNNVIHWSVAQAKPKLDTLLVLLRAGANCNIQNTHGDTPLHIACRQSNTRICLTLIANSADLMIKNKAQELPYDCIPDEESQCARAVGFNMQMRSFGSTGLRNKIICSDISNGRELRPIQAVRNLTHNDETDETMLPDFKYISKSIILQNYSIQIDRSITQMRICNCIDSCNSEQCQCTIASTQNWYTPEGRLNGEFNFDDPATIFECNDVCGCNKLCCKNRIVQNGIKIPLQIFECAERSKGWGVRSLVKIPKGSFVVEYTGEILTDIEADRRMDDSYFFDLGADHCIDANYYGNVSRFFNHSCMPNIVPIRVFIDHQDKRFPKIAFFTNRDVSIREELCFDYGDRFWKVKTKYFTCKCLTHLCRYTQTLSNDVSVADS